MARFILAILFLIATVFLVFAESQKQTLPPNSTFNYKYFVIPQNFHTSPFNVKHVLSRRSPVGSFFPVGPEYQQQPTHDVESQNQESTDSENDDFQMTPGVKTFSQGLTNITSAIFKPWVHFHNRLSKTANTLPDLFAANGARKYKITR